ncbi:hypothetical protein BJI69_11020 [Luteibacter rhizovicinus DSM 16549]|uniref:Secreted protein n=1 Tax=Luteibacter rhizovicinus DSM 16549 TaxID=1440763 RepID=A0A1L3ETJ1_9GAMM|nr:hypothetical protein [Luteibacter rhizovicinus]APG04375.1 hypothetical protein BJI69_11020 [Luteibacter rhizovicinus DSM 16549]KLD75316.1 hypothetical protein Y886_27805 [Xanthomonas hyacinthi DSM 19077]
MMKKAWCAATLAIGLVSAGHVRAVEGLSDAVGKEEMCKHTLCQHDIRVTLKTKDGGTYDHTFDVLPGTVQPFGLAIVAGQALNLEADVTGDTVSNFRAVAVVTHPEKTLTASLEQSPKGDMILSLHNPFDRPLKFDMGIMPLDNDKVLATSSCPIKAGMSSFEMWPGALFQVLLTKPRFVGTTGKAMNCD